MTTLEQRITETLAAHTWQSVDIQGRITCSCEAPGITGDHDDHVAAALLPLIREREAEAFDEGRQWIAEQMGDVNEDTPDPSPYRADNLEAS